MGSGRDEHREHADRRTEDAERGDVGSRRPDEDRREQRCAERRPQDGRHPGRHTGGDGGSDREPRQHVGGGDRERGSDRDRREHGPAAKARAEREGICKALGHHEQEQHAGGALGDERGHLGLAREQHEVDRPIRQGAEEHRKDSDEETGDHERGDRPDGRTPRDAEPGAAGGDDDGGHGRRDERAPGQIDDSNRLVVGDPRQGEVLLMEP